MEKDRVREREGEGEEEKERERKRYWERERKREKSICTTMQCMHSVLQVHKWKHIHTHLLPL